MVAPILTTILAADWRIYDPDAQARPQPQARIPKPSPYNRSRFPPLRQLFRIAPASLARRSHCGSLKVQYGARKFGACGLQPLRSEEHTSELQSLMRISSAVFCLNTKHPK